MDDLGGEADDRRESDARDSRRGENGAAGMPTAKRMTGRQTTVEQPSASRLRSTHRAPTGTFGVDLIPRSGLKRGGKMNALPKKSAAASLRPDIPRRAGDKSQQAPAGKSGQQSGRAFPESKGKQLIVGREISLTGEIKDCEQLVVEGSVEAALVGSDMLVVLDGGAFTGPAEVREAHINGRFEGELTVTGRLVVMSSAELFGKVRYGELEVQRGGAITGDLAPLG